MFESPTRRKSVLAAAVVVVTVVFYPLIYSDGYHLGVGVVAGATAISTVGVVLLLGMARTLALGQAGFSMIGGYISAILCVDYEWDPLTAMLVGMVVTMLLAWFIAAPLLKLRGFVLLMASLALHLMLIVVANQWPITGAAMGTTGVPKFALFGLHLTSDIAFFYVVWAFALLSVAIGLSIDQSRIGRALRAISGSETAAGSVGMDTTRYKVQMFVIGAGMASVSGSFIVHYLRAIDPTVFDFNYSLNLVTGTIVGGLLSVWGGALGATVIVGLRELLRDLSLPLWESTIMGALTVVILLTFPRGLAGFVSRIYDRALAPRERHQVSIAPPGMTCLATFIEPHSYAGAMLEVIDVSRSFGNLRAVNNVSCTVAAGSITALIGPNGAGKTTLFNLIGGYQPLDLGTVKFEGQDVHELLPKQIAELGIARTFQNLELFDSMTVLENVMCGRHRLLTTGILSICFRLPSVGRQEREARQAALASLAFVGLEGAEHVMPSALSFGHQRMVEIARALALQPRLLLMDEPASGLNDTETERLAELIMRIAALGVTVLLVEHDMRLVMGLADHVVVMDHGEKMAEGQTDLVRADPKVIAAYLGQEAASERVA